MANKKLLLTSQHVNYLIFRYLQEAGFTHSAFTFAHESNAVQAPLDPSSVAPGSLIALLQKGLQFLELEANLDGSDGDVDADFKMLTPEELVSNDIDQLRQLVQERREEERATGTTGRVQPAEKPKRENKLAAKDKDRDKEKGIKTVAGASPQPRGAANEKEQDGPQPMDEEPSTLQLEVPPSAITSLQGHDADVYICAWHAGDNLLATGAADKTARIWTVGSSGRGSGKTITLQHEFRPGYLEQLQQSGETEEPQLDVTTLDWSPDGSSIATGSSDGFARIWTKEGKLKHTLDKHKDAVLTVKWNKKGDLLLTGSMDGQTIVWDAKSGEPRQVWQLHTAGVLDVDWRNNSSFASCSSDRHVYLCKLGEREAQRSWTGHTDEVNALRWDPNGTYLASGSDDHTARIWSVKSDEAVQTLHGHAKGIYAVRWRPAGPNGVLATASFDHTVRLWDVESGRCITTLTGHTGSVFALDFSPNGKYLATGSEDKQLFIWSVPDGRLLRTLRCDEKCVHVSWSPSGEKLAVCVPSKPVWVLDVRS